MSDASQILVTQGDAPASVLAGKSCLYATGDGEVRVLAASGSVARLCDYAAMPGHYARDIAWAAQGNAAAADRYTLLSPNRMTVNVEDVGLYLAEQIALVLSDADVWDSTATDYTVAANRAGKDFYFYACLVGGMILKVVISANATYPTGYTADNSRKVGGFHCLCADVGTISGHTLSGYVAGDILPASVWDLKHRHPIANEGRVYDPGTRRWLMIYPPSYSGGKLVSIFGGTVITGTTSPAMDWYDFCTALAAVGDRLVLQYEFMSASAGSNQGTNIAGSTNPVTAGGHVDTAGRRMISNLGVEDACGVWWQWGLEAGGPYSAAAWTEQFAAASTSQRGMGYNVPNRVLLGGAWGDGANCGSRGSVWANGPLLLIMNIGARGVAEPLAVGL